MTTLYKTLPDWWGIFIMAFSVTIMAYAGRFGPAPIVVFYALWVPWVLVKGMSIAMPSRDTLLCLGFCAFCVLSTVWSDFRPVTLYSSLEYTSLVLCTIIMVRILSDNSWMLGLSAGCTIVIIVALLSGSYAEDPFTKATSLVGYFGSKNQVGLFAELGIYVALIVMFSKRWIMTRLLYGFIPLLICLDALLKSKSASSVMSLAGTLAIVGVAWAVTRLPRRARALALIASTLVVGLMVAMVFATGLDEVILQSFGKDMTLTGRTYLWGEGIRLGMKHWLLGDGYNAFWVQGRPEAEQYWHQFEIPNRTGFHFHDLFVQTFVDLGAVGLATIVFIVARNCLRSFRAVIRYDLHPETTFLLGLSFMLLIRAAVEVDIIGTFSIGPMLFFSILPRLARYDLERRGGIRVDPARA